MNIKLQKIETKKREEPLNGVEAGKAYVLKTKKIKNFTLN